jgi:hypothetical protein
MIPGIPLPIIAAVAAAAIAAASAWTVQGWRMGEQLAALKTEYATAQHKALEAAHATTIALQAKADNAQKLHAARAATLANDAAGVRSALVSLSDAADGALRVANNSHAACIDRAAAFASVFDQCSKRIGSLAQDADAINNDRQALIEAWPK